MPHSTMQDFKRSAYNGILMDRIISVRLPSTLDDRVEAVAARLGYSKSDFIRLCIEERLGGLGSQQRIEIFIKDPEPIVRFLKILGKKLEGGSRD